MNVCEECGHYLKMTSSERIELSIDPVCSSGGARMQEGSLSLMQMAKISSVLCDYQSSKNKFWYVGDIIIAEPYAYIAFAGKRVIEQTLKKKAVPEGSQAADLLLRKGLLDAIVPRNPLKGVV
ncbi:unnamed protein product, partial [Brassica napus]